MLVCFSVCVNDQVEVQEKVSTVDAVSERIRVLERKLEVCVRT